MLNLIMSYPYSVDSVEVFWVPSEHLVPPLLVQPDVCRQHLVLLVLRDEQMIIFFLSPSADLKLSFNSFSHHATHLISSYCPEACGNGSYHNVICCNILNGSYFLAHCKIL